LAERPLVFVVLGTRPEAIKMLPVIRALQGEPRLATRVITTGQHREMVDQILSPFGVVPDHDLDVMRPDQTLNDIVCRVIPLLDKLYVDLKPQLVLVQGDTSSAFAAALAAFHRGIKVGHVEAGLRSGDRAQPFPEESNRRMITCVADLHLAATPANALILAREGVRREEIAVTGNTVIDALLDTLSRTDLLEGRRCRIPGLADGGSLVLMTLHRRENYTRPGGPGTPSALERIFDAVAAAAREFPGTAFVYPVHRNPNVQEPARRLLGNLPNVHLLDPQPYIPFVDLMSRSTLLLTDSGGIQEEAPSLGVPVLVARETTERPEGVDCGTNVVVGTRTEVILREIRSRLVQPRMSSGPRPRPNPFGDGQAGLRIRQAVLHCLGLGERPGDFRPDAAVAGSVAVGGETT
jgi:UDP-N-acetylglucosamine 2-epimerase (non-hydrolysing)